LTRLGFTVTYLDLPLRWEESWEWKTLLFAGVGDLLTVCLGTAAAPPSTNVSSTTGKLLWCTEACLGALVPVAHSLGLSTNCLLLAIDIFLPPTPSHYGGHGLKYQAVVTPDGIVVDLYGPVVGRHHDSDMLDKSRILGELPKFSHVNGDPYYIYGDPAYPLRTHLQRPFKGSLLSEEEEEYNTAMSSVRVAVEWAFKEVSMSFSALDFVRNEKIRLSPLSLKYKAAVILTNCLTCIRRRNQISLYFNLSPPSIDIYLSSGRRD